MPYSEKFSAIDATFSVRKRRWHSMQSFQNLHRKSCFYPCSVSRNVLQRFIFCRYSSSVRVFERYSMMGGNRLSLTLTMFQNGDSPIRLSAITAGGSQAVFFKVNTIGEESFLEDVKNLLEEILEE